MKLLAKYSIWIASFFFAFIFSYTSVFTAKADADTTAPTISVSNAVIKTYIGSEPVLNVTAVDDVDEETEIIITWSDNALDDLGCLTEGEHTCMITATDSSANTATVVLTYIVMADLADNGEYVFVTIVCEGMDTVVKTYRLNDTIDMSAYPEKEGYLKTVKNSKGDTVTNFTAIADCTLYVTYTEIIPEVILPQTPSTDKEPTSTTGCFSGIATSGGGIILVGLVVTVINLFKKKGE